MQWTQILLNKGYEIQDWFTEYAPKKSRINKIKYRTYKIAAGEIITAKDRIVRFKNLQIQIV